MEIILDECGYTDMLKADKSPQAQTRLENLKELVRAMGDFDSLNAFLEHIELVMDASQGEETDDQVQILTLHAAKGLEMADGVPARLGRGGVPLQTLAGGDRRARAGGRTTAGLCRRHAGARAVLYISFVANRQIYGRWQSVMPSRFRR